MTHATALALVRQRDDLVAQIAIERAAIARNSASLRQLSRMIDKVSRGIHYLKRHPETLLLPVVITVLARPWRLLALAVSGFGAWRMVQSWRRRILS
ncbi:YqjK family protein [Sulfuricaulis limicola]|uniref:YqjK family protein n=1 Tax=Sulfuricaulis limicola TaxID=1620215 RepID=UPI000BBB2658|nr:YqjK family protein [Sulfuricaulis limicola]